MRSRDAERRAFLRNPKMRMLEIQDAQAEATGFKVTQEELDADIEAAKKEHRAKHPRTTPDSEVKR